jgi:hypothetical protein
MRSMPSRLTLLPPSCVEPGAPSRLGDTPPTTAGLRMPLFWRGQSVTTSEHCSLNDIIVRLELGLETIPCGVAVV